LCFRLGTYKYKTDVQQAVEAAHKRKNAELSVQALAAPVLLADTIQFSKLILACIADAVCTRRLVAHANECKMPFDIFFNP
jgi:hypothetical protein